MRCGAGTSVDLNMMRCWLRLSLRLGGVWWFLLRRLCYAATHFQLSLPQDVTNLDAVLRHRPLPCVAHLNHVRPNAMHTLDCAIVCCHRRIAAEKMDARIAITPLLEAEADRA